MRRLTACFIASFFLFTTPANAAKKPVPWQTFKANRLQEASPVRMLAPKLIPHVLPEIREKYAEWQEAWTNHLEYKEAEEEAVVNVSPTYDTSTTVSVWDAVAACESSGDWSINTGNGYWGGLQFAPSTWFAYGGGPFNGTGPFPYSREAQIAVAEAVLASQGEGAWPNCFP